jgi:2-dehydropantoate 2-reductase
VVFLGAGAIGCFVGLSWLGAGMEVAFVGRPAIGDILSRFGGRISAKHFDRRIPPDKIEFAHSAGGLRSAALIVITVKSLATEVAAQEIRQHAPPDALILTLQNGVTNAARLTELLPDRTILSGMVAYNVINRGGGHFFKATSGNLVLEADHRLQAELAMLKGKPDAVLFARDIEAVKWGKLLFNLNNPLNALSGVTLKQELSDRAWRRILAAMIGEALAVMASSGISPAKVGALPPGILPFFIGLPNFIFRQIGIRLQGIDDEARSSMADDFDAGRKTEIDFLNGEIVRLARHNALIAPLNAAIVDLVHAAENGGRKIWSAPDLMNRIGLI